MNKTYDPTRSTYALKTLVRASRAYLCEECRRWRPAESWTVMERGRKPSCPIHHEDATALMERYGLKHE